MKLKNKLILIFIFLLAFGLRFHRLDTYPALNADEAAIGYNAYSLMKTGFDEHGHAWPIHFQSFNDYKPGLYFYIVLPFVKVLGLNEWAVRIPGASFGVLSIIAIYFLVKELFDDEKLGIVSSLFLAISPWHIHFSRGGWEVNTATFFIISGLLFLFKGLKEELSKKRIVYLTFSSLFLVASAYTYHAARVIVPLLGVCFLLIYWKKILSNIKPYIIFVVMTLILITPLARDMLSSGTLSRASGVGILADLGPVARVNEQRGEHQGKTTILAKLMHNKAVNYGLFFLNNYFSHFNGEFLFMSGDSIERDKVPETGEMYLFDIIFLLVGFAFLSKEIKNNKNWLFIISWLIVAPFASSLTFQSPTALRSQNMVIPFVVISAFGFVNIIDWLGKRKMKLLKPLGIVFISLFVVWNFLRYLNMYYLHMAKNYPYSSQYGVKELVSYVSENQNKYSDIFITQRYDQPYILFLFYLKYPPKKFQGAHTLTSRDSYGFSTVADFDKYHFDLIDFQSISENYPGSLIIGTPEEIPDTANIIKRIYGINGFEYFDAVQN